MNFTDGNVSLLTDPKTQDVQKMEKKEGFRIFAVVLRCLVCIELVGQRIIVSNIDYRNRNGKKRPIF